MGAEWLSRKKAVRGLARCYDPVKWEKWELILGQATGIP